MVYIRVDWLTCRIRDIGCIVNGSDKKLYVNRIVNIRVVWLNIWRRDISCIVNGSDKNINFKIKTNV